MQHNTFNCTITVLASQCKDCIFIVLKHILVKVCANPQPKVKSLSQLLIFTKISSYVFEIKSYIIHICYMSIDKYAIENGHCIDVHLLVLMIRMTLPVAKIYV